MNNPQAVEALRELSELLSMATASPVGTIFRARKLIAQYEASTQQQAEPSAPRQERAEPVFPLIEQGRYQLICTNGCGRCGIKLSEFEYERTETLAGEFVSRKVCPQIVSTCCGNEVEVWDEVAQENMPHKIMAVTLAQLYAPGQDFRTLHPTQPAPQPEAQALPDSRVIPNVDQLAQFIREIDGAHRFGAGALAERICEWLAVSSPAPAPTVKESLTVQGAPAPLIVGRLPTVNQDPYPALGDWWVQLWDGSGDDAKVVARAYGSTPQEAHERATQLAAIGRAQQ